MAGKRHRRLQQKQDQLVEPVLVQERQGRIVLEDGWNSLGDHLLGAPGSVSAIMTGLTTSVGAGLSVDVASGSLIQAIGDAWSHVIESDDKNVALAAADPTNPRYDVIQAEVRQRGAYQDTSEELVDAVLSTIGPLAVERDWEYYLDVTSVTGTPAVSPVPPSIGAGTKGKITGTVTTDVLDCSVKRYLRLSFGETGEFLLVDIAGSTPSATTLAERIAAINAAFSTYGVVADDDGGALRLRDITVGWSSLVRFRQPTDPSIDALNLVLGLTESSNYFYEFRGTSNPAVKLAEIYVEANATTLGAEDVVGVDDKGSWVTTDSNIVLPSFQTHRTADPIDHPDESIGLIKLKPEVKAGITNKLTNLRGPHAVIYPVAGDPTGGKLATLMLRDVELFTALGASQNREDQEQEFPVNRVDQEESDISGPDYVCQVALTETALDKINFIPSLDYFFTDNFNRLGVYINDVGSGYTHLRFELHDSGNVTQSFVEIPIASLATGWFYAQFPASVVPGASYHGHVYCVGFTAGTTARLATKTGGTAVSFRELYLPDGGKFGSASTADVLHLLEPDGTEIVSVRLSGDDDITAPGEGFLGDTGYDVMAADLSNQTFWENAEHREFILIDLLNGRVKLPPALAFGTWPDPIYGEYNLQEGQDQFDARNVLMHRYGPEGPSVDDAIRWDWDPANNAIRTDQNVGIGTDPGTDSLSVSGPILFAGNVKFSPGFSPVDSLGNPVAGWLDDGTPYYKKASPLVITLNVGVSGNSAPHGIPNAYTNHRIIGLMHTWDNGSRDQWYNDANGTAVGVSPFSIEFAYWDDTDLTIAREIATNPVTFYIWLTYK